MRVRAGRCDAEEIGEKVRKLSKAIFGPLERRRFRCAAATAAATAAVPRNEIFEVNAGNWHSKCIIARFSECATISAEIV